MNASIVVAILWDLTSQSVLVIWLSATIKSANLKTKRMVIMEKIVILTEQPEPDQDLVVWLHELFPDCEIQIVFKGTEAFGDYPADCLHFRLQRTQQGKHNGQHFSN